MKKRKGKGDRRTDLHTLAATPLPTIVNYPPPFMNLATASPTPFSVATDRKSPRQREKQEWWGKSGFESTIFTLFL